MVQVGPQSWPRQGHLASTRHERQKRRKLLAIAVGMARQCLAGDSTLNRAPTVELARSDSDHANDSKPHRPTKRTNGCAHAAKCGTGQRHLDERVRRRCAAQVAAAVKSDSRDRVSVSWYVQFLEARIEEMQRQLSLAAATVGNVEHVDEAGIGNAYETGRGMEFDDGLGTPVGEPRSYEDRSVKGSGSGEGLVKGLAAAGEGIAAYLDRTRSPQSGMPAPSPGVHSPPKARQSLPSAGGSQEQSASSNRRMDSCTSCPRHMAWPC